MLVGLVFLTVLYFATMMMVGRHPPMVYQFAFSVMISLVAGALSTQNPVSASTLRIVLTLVGAVGAAFLTALLERLLIGDEAHDRLIVPEP